MTAGPAQKDLQTRTRRALLILGALGALLFGTLLAIVGRGNLGHFLLCATTVFPLAIALSVTGSTVLLSRMAKRRAWRLVWDWSATLAGIATLICLSVVFSYPVGEGWRWWSTKPALAWCNEVVGRLQTHQAVHDRLPESLEEPEGYSRPWWAPRLDYRTDGTSFSLMFDEDFEQDRGTGFDSARCAWTVRGDGPDEPESVPYREQLRYLQD